MPKLKWLYTATNNSRCELGKTIAELLIIYNFLQGIQKKTYLKYCSVTFAAELVPALRD